ncbi:outer membrane protein assembly factor BamB family protein [Sorangium sp. So ce1097]|uniref:outer membrane protein assembly factor BamB family protein n=1 Tax=Sorangium sp. So ce1097 TaxID=3133330 RepID=UPI003F635FB3
MLNVLAAACDGIPLDPIRGDDAGGATGQGGGGGSGSGGGSAGSGSGSAGSAGSGGGSAGSGGGSAGSGGAPSTGDPLWSRHFGANAGEPQLSRGRIAVDGAGHVVLAMAVADGVDFGDGPLSIRGRSVFALAKFDGEGALLWDKQVSDSSSVHDVAVNPAGLIATTGSTRGSSVDFGGGPLVGPEDGTDAFVAVFTADGDHVWSARIGADSDQVADHIAVDAAGNVVVAGFFLDQISLCGASLTSADQADSYIAKFDPAGNCLWSKQFGYTEIHNVAVDASGSVVLAGSFGDYFTETIDLGGGPLITAGREDIFVAKLDADGEHLWSKRFGDAALQRAYGVAVDGSGDIVVSGTFQGSVDFGGGPLVSSGGFEPLGPGSVTWGGNAFVTKLNPEGELLWAKRLGQDGPQTALDVATTVGGELAITGLMYGDVDFGTGLMECTYGDAFVAKIDATGTVRWVKHTGDRGHQYGHSTAMDGAGNVFVAGPFVGTIDFGAGPLVNRRSASDVFLVKLGP